MTWFLFLTLKITVALLKQCVGSSCLFVQAPRQPAMHCSAPNYEDAGQDLQFCWYHYGENQHPGDSECGSTVDAGQLVSTAYSECLIKYSEHRQLLLTAVCFWESPIFSFTSVRKISGFQQPSHHIWFRDSVETSSYVQWSAGFGWISL